MLLNQRFRIGRLRLLYRYDQYALVIMMCEAILVDVELSIIKQRQRLVAKVQWVVEVGLSCRLFIFQLLFIADWLVYCMRHPVRSNKLLISLLFPCFRLRIRAHSSRASHRTAHSWVSSLKAWCGCLALEYEGEQPPDVSNLKKNFSLKMFFVEMS